MIDGPLLVGEDYLIRREVVALSESKRTESYWVLSRIYDASGEVLKAEMLLNHATLKHSYANYEARPPRSEADRASGIAPLHRRRWDYQNELPPLRRTAACPLHLPTSRHCFAGTLMLFSLPAHALRCGTDIVDEDDLMFESCRPAASRSRARSSAT